MDHQWEFAKSVADIAYEDIANHIESLDEKEGEDWDTARIGSVRALEILGNMWPGISTVIKESQSVRGADLSNPFTARDASIDAARSAFQSLLVDLEDIES